MELEGKDKRLDGEYDKANPLRKPSTRENAIQKCYEVARDRGYNYFGVNNGGLCVGSFDAEFRYKTRGKGTSCKDGKGGQWTNDVYFILRKSSMYTSLLCIHLFACTVFLSTSARMVE